MDQLHEGSHSGPPRRAFCRRRTSAAADKCGDKKRCHPPNRRAAADPAVIFRPGQEKKPQISPLRYAPVEMTNLLRGWRRLSMEKDPFLATNLSSRPERSVVERSAVSFPGSHTRSLA